MKKKMGLLRTKVCLKGQLQVLAEVKNIILEAKINLLIYVDKTAIEMKNLLGNQNNHDNTLGMGMKPNYLFPF